MSTDDICDSEDETDELITIKSILESRMMGLKQSKINLILQCKNEGDLFINNNFANREIGKTYLDASEKKLKESNVATIVDILITLYDYIKSSNYKDLSDAGKAIISTINKAESLVSIKQKKKDGIQFNKRGITGESSKKPKLSETYNISLLPPNDLKFCLFCEHESVCYSTDPKVVMEINSNRKSNYQQNTLIREQLPIAQRGPKNSYRESPIYLRCHCSEMFNHNCADGGQCINCVSVIAAGFNCDPNNCEMCRCQCSQVYKFSDMNKIKLQLSIEKRHNNNRSSAIYNNTNNSNNCSSYSNNNTSNSKYNNNINGGAGINSYGSENTIANGIYNDKQWNDSVESYVGSTDFISNINNYNNDTTFDHSSIIAQTYMKAQNMSLNERPSRFFHNGTRPNQLLSQSEGFRSQRNKLDVTNNMIMSSSDRDKSRTLDLGNIENTFLLHLNSFI